MLARSRHERILATLHARGPVEVGDLARMLEVSDATVRRDLSRLESEGMLSRVHGGAAPLGTAEPPWEQVAVDHLDAKEAVADAAADLVRDGDVVLLDIGTTTHLVARRLRGRPITVITTSLAVYDELVRDDLELILLGGVVRRNYRSMVGFLTEQAIRQVHADLLVLGTSGVRRDGSVLDTTAVEVPVKRAMLSVAERVVLVADESKFPGRGIARVCGPDRLDDVVTGAGADPATLAVLREEGVEVVCARPVGDPPVNEPPVTDPPVTDPVGAVSR